MNMFKTTVCITALCAGTGAMADVTAQQVLDDWKDNFAEASDANLTTGSEDTSDGVVRATDMMLTGNNDDGTFTVDIGDVTFTEQGDGTVAVQMEDSYQINFQQSDSESVAIEVNQAGLVMVASGSDADMSYAISADRYAVSIVEILEGGEPVLDGDILLTLNNLAGTFGTVTNELQELSYDFDIGSLDLLIDFVEPRGDGNVLVSGKIEAMESASNMNVPLDFPDTEDPFVQGFGVLTNVAFDTANFIFDVDADGSTAVGSVAIGAGTTASSMNRDEMETGFSLENVAIAMEGSDLPIPVSINLANIGTGLNMPLSVTEAPTDFSMFAKLTELTVNDDIWNMGDPAGVLARDPITFDLDLSGKTKLFFDILDPAQEAAREMADNPAELHALSINNLLVSAAGAMVTGSGAFTFDNNDMTSFDGIPRPLGDATVEITGANGLIDNLVSMGLLPADQASMGRMMMGMFARSVGDDQLQTKVEVNAEGHLIVNGQRMQ